MSVASLFQGGASTRSQQNLSLVHVYSDGGGGGEGGGEGGGGEGGGEGGGGDGEWEHLSSVDPRPMHMLLFGLSVQKI